MTRAASVARQPSALRLRPRDVRRARGRAVDGGVPPCSRRLVQDRRPALALLAAPALAMVAPTAGRPPRITSSARRPRSRPTATGSRTRCGCATRVPRPHATDAWRSAGLMTTTASCGQSTWACSLPARYRWTWDGRDQSRPVCWTSARDPGPTRTGRGHRGLAPRAVTGRHRSSSRPSGAPTFGAGRDVAARVFPRTTVVDRRPRRWGPYAHEHEGGVPAAASSATRPGAWCGDADVDETAASTTTGSTLRHRADSAVGRASAAGKPLPQGPLHGGGHRA